MSGVASVPLREVAELRSGGTPDKKRTDFYRGDIPWITGADIDDRRVTGARSFITPDAIRLSAASVVEAGTVLLVTRTGVGKVAVAPHDVSFSQDITAISPERSSVDTAYLARFLRSRSAHFERHARGATIKGVTREVVGSLSVPLLPLDEQRRIAGVLDAADALRAKRRIADRRLEGFIRSLFLAAFGDPVNNPRSWPTTTLGAIGRLNRGVSTHRPRNAPQLLGGPYPFIQTGDVAGSSRLIRRFRSTYSEAGLKQSKLWPAGTLCITIAANIADTGVLTFDACFPDSVVAFTADPATTRYVQVWLSFLQQTLRAAAPQSAQKNINLRILRALPIPEPPTDLREGFAASVGAVEDVRRSHFDQLHRLDALFASLQSRAFSGEL